jgi:hypothetical protein
VKTKELGVTQVRECLSACLACLRTHVRSKYKNKISGGAKGQKGEYINLKCSNYLHSTQFKTVVLRAGGVIQWETLPNKQEALGLILPNTGGENKMTAVHMSMKTLPLAILLSFVFFLVFWGFKFRTSCLLGRHSYCLSHSALSWALI